MSLIIKDVFMIPEKESETHKPWMRVGIAFINKDSSMNVILDAIPMSGKLHIRERKTKSTDKGAYYENK